MWLIGKGGHLYNKPRKDEGPAPCEKCRPAFGGDAPERPASPDFTPASTFQANPPNCRHADRSGHGPTDRAEVELGRWWARGRSGAREQGSIDVRLAYLIDASGPIRHTVFHVEHAGRGRSGEEGACSRRTVILWGGLW